MSADFYWPTRVYYEDTDATGVVYHARYLHFFERARTEWLRGLGTSQQNLRDVRGVVFTVANIEINFRSPARLDDQLRVSVAVDQQKRASLMFGQTIVRDAVPDQVLAAARVRVACVNAESFRPCAIPDSLFSNTSSNGVCA